MEEPLLSRFLGMFSRKIPRMDLLRSGMLTALVLTSVLLGLGLGCKERGKGHLTRLTQGEPPPQRPQAPRPGGQDPIILSRPQSMTGTIPEFLTATLLPGRGMNVLQITAFVPGRGEISLLSAPTLEEANKLMTGKGDDANGNASLQAGAAFMAPFAGRVFGTLNQNENAVTTSWRGHSITLPANVSAGSNSQEAISNGGLLLNLPADNAEMNTMPDGGEAKASFDAEDFHGRWPSKTKFVTSVFMSGRAVDLVVTATNTGTEPEPMGIGWNPTFVIPSGDRAQARLRMSNAERVETTNKKTLLPSGRVVPVANTPYDFTARGGRSLDALSLDDEFVHLKPAFLDNGPTVELIDLAANFGLRITALTLSVKDFRIVAPAGKPVISIQPLMDHSDPFGHAWAKDEDTGMVTLAPGQSVQWKVRLELFVPRKLSAADKL